MTTEFLSQLFSLEGKVALVTGGTGVLGGAMAQGLAGAGAYVGIIGRRKELGEVVAKQIEDAGGQAIALPADVLDEQQLASARDTALAKWGHIDILVNAAGGNISGAIILPDQSFTDMPRTAFEQVMGLNLTGTVLPSQIFGKVMAEQRQGVIVNISSLAATRALTRVVGYAAAKAGVENFTHWLAVEMAQKYGEGLRVNAIAPGFFLGEQNRRMLVNEDNSLTPRGQTIVSKTPMGRFGEPNELVSTLVWMCSPGARFVTGVVVQVDGGFNAYSGV